MAMEHWDKMGNETNGDGDSQTHDLSFSADFARSVLPLSLKRLRSVALECGAGEWRVSERLLLELVERLEVQLPVQGLATATERRLGDRLTAPPHICRLQDFYPRPESYDLIWLQWTLTYLSGSEALAALRRLQLALKSRLSPPFHSQLSLLYASDFCRPGGFLFMKETIFMDPDTKDIDMRWGGFVRPDDGGHVRTKLSLLQICKDAGSIIVASNKSTLYACQIQVSRFTRRM